MLCHAMFAGRPFGRSFVSFTVLISALLVANRIVKADDVQPLGAAVLANVKRATVRVEVKDASGAEMMGSGCLISEPGVVLTNAHVLGMFDADSRPPRTVAVVIDSGEPTTQTVPARLLGVDRRADLAALRIEAKNLPAPLSLADSNQLRETQVVYAIGFPLGKRLGENITITKSSVSSLRKENGRLKEVQLDGGVHRGNSGGPVVDDQGRVIGLAVSAVSGTTIGFAIPAEHVAGFLAGRLNDYGTEIAIREGGKIKILYHLNFVDPLGRIKDVRIEHYQGPRAKPNPDGTQRPTQRSGETAVVSVDLPYKGAGAVRGELEVEPLKDSKFIYWFRPVYRDGNRQEQFAHELSGMQAAPFERRPLTVKFAPRSGPGAPMELTNISAFRLRMPGGQEDSRSMLLKVIYAPEYRPAPGGETGHMLLRFQRFSIAMKVNGKLEKPTEFQAIANNVVKTAALLELDSDGTPLSTDLKLSKADAKLRPALTEIEENLLQAIELLAVPLPNGEVQPLEVFRVRRNVAAGMPGMELPAQVDLKFSYQGTHAMSSGRPSAMFDFSGAVRPRRGDKLNMSGDVHGRVEVSPASGEILRATTDLKVDVDLQSSVGLIRVTGTMHGELKPPPSAAPPERKPDKPPVLAADDRRVKWVFSAQGKDNASGSFERTPDATWTETNARGERHTFEEWVRGADYVVLVDPQRKVYLRCYADHLDIFNNQRKWVTLYKGSWENASRQ
ncbi:MAG TPA: S1C family serine protease [Pirellulales bacterium]